MRRVATSVAAMLLGLGLAGHAGAQSQPAAPKVVVIHAGSLLDKPGQAPRGHAHRDGQRQRRHRLAKGGDGGGKGPALIQSLAQPLGRHLRQPDPAELADCDEIGQCPDALADRLGAGGGPLEPLQDGATTPHPSNQAWFKLKGRN